MDGPLLLITITFAILPSMSEGTNHACLQAGGVCSYRYKGCENGRFEDGLCVGPDYYQCCIVKPDIDPEVLARPKWRMCHECTYSVNRGRVKGTEQCSSLNSQVEEMGFNIVNCTGQCTKELLTLDADNYQLIRGCSSDCHSEMRTSMHQVYCCWGELCNTAPGCGLSVSLLAVTACLTMYIHSIAMG